jgi:hypothetical protein
MHGNCFILMFGFVQEKSHIQCISVHYTFSVRARVLFLISPLQDGRFFKCPLYLFKGRKPVLFDYLDHRFSGARVSSISSISYISSISSISSRGDGLNPNVLYPPLEEEGPPLFSQLSRNLLNKCCEFNICRH